MGDEGRLRPSAASPEPIPHVGSAATSSERCSHRIRRARRPLRLPRDRPRVGPPPPSVARSSRAPSSISASSSWFWSEPSPSRLHPTVVAPADDDFQRINLRVHQEAEPHGRREEALLRGLAVLYRGHPRDLHSPRHRDRRPRPASPRCLAGIPRGTRNPVRYQLDRPHSARKALVRQRMPGPRPDQIEPERLHDLLANLGGFRQSRHITPGRHLLPASSSSNETTSRRSDGKRADRRTILTAPPARFRSSERDAPGRSSRSLTDPQHD